MFAKITLRGKLTGLLLAVATVSQAQSPLVPDRLGRDLGCETSPDADPYCTNTEVRALVFEQHVLVELLSNEPTIEVTVDMNLGLSGSLPPVLALRSFRSMVRISVRRCRGDEACILDAMREKTSVLRDLAGLPASEPSVTEAEIAASNAAQGEAKLAMIAAGEAIDAEYAAEWEQIRKLLAPPDDPDLAPPNLGRYFPAPERWSRERKQRCRDDMICMAERPQVLNMLVDRRKRAVRDTAKRERRAAQKARLQRQQEAARKARQKEIERRRAERVAALRAIDVDAILPLGSQLRPLLIEGFEAFDRQVAIPFATKIGDDFAGAALFFGAAGMSKRLRRAIVENRRNLVAAAYGFSRRDILGYCDDEVVQVYIRTTPEIERRTLGGATIQRYGGADVYVRVPRRFARFVEASHFENSVGLFADEISRFGSCDNPLLSRLEDNLVNYVRGNPFVRWDP